MTVFVVVQITCMYAFGIAYSYIVSKTIIYRCYFKHASLLSIVKLLELVNLRLIYVLQVQHISNFFSSQAENSSFILI